VRLPISIPSTLRNIGITFGGNALSRVFTAVSLVVVLKTIPVEQYGLVALFQSIITLGSGFLPQGMNWALIRSISSDTEHAGSPRNTALVLSTFVLELVAVVFTAAILVVFPSTISALFRVGSVGGSLLVLAALGIVTTAMGGFIAALYQGRHRFGASAFLTILQTALVLLAYVLLRSTGLLNYDRILWVIVLGPVVVFLLGLAMEKRDWLRERLQWLDLISMLRESKWFIGYTIILVFVGQLDVFMVARYCDLKDLGSYGLATRIYHVLMLSLAAIHTVLLPKLSSNPDRYYLLSVVRKSFKLTLPFALVLTIPVIVFAKEIVLLLSGTSYMDAAGPMQILLVGAAISLVLSPMTNVLFALKRESLVLSFSFVLLLVQCVGHVSLTSRYGPIGAALTTVLAYGVFNGLIAIWAYRAIRQPAAEAAAVEGRR
jgi:O-antigen/teichoic acid export membrane protein